MTNTFKAPKDVALVIVDVQNDFCTGGNLAVPEGEDTVPVINNLRDAFQTVVLTQDWHPKRHQSFARTHGADIFTTKEFDYGTQVLWPDHCVQNTKGAEFHDDLIVKSSDLILRKGDNLRVDSYSAFHENDGKTQPKFANGNNFEKEMKDRGIKTLVFAGLAKEICVAWNAEDALKAKFNSIIVENAAKAFDAKADLEKMEELKKAGVKIVKTNDLPYYLNKNLKFGLHGM